MPVTRRALLPLPLLAAGAVSADGYLEDPATAAGVSFVSPRASLGECLAVLGKASGLGLEVVPGLTGEDLVGCSLRRPLRELMAALARLYGARWARGAGGYRLEPDPALHRLETAARARDIQRERRALDAAVAENLRKLKAGALAPTVQSQRVMIFGSLIWSHATPAQRDLVFQGRAVHFPVPEAQGRPLYETLLSLSNKKAEPLQGPLLATIDLEDLADTGWPTLRTRASARRRDSVLSIITTFALPGTTDRKPLPAPEPDSEDAVASPSAGDNGRLQGTREELVALAGKELGVPILSRHRAWGGTAGVAIGGRRIRQVIHDIAQSCEATVSVTSRGFYLLRSRTAAFDALGQVPTPVAAQLRAAFPPDREPEFERFAVFGALTPLQISLLQRGNICPEVAELAGSAYAVIRFVESLTTQQRTALFGAGVDATTLSHHQLHLLLDQRDKRADFDVYEHLQEISGLRLRAQKPNAGEGDLVLSTSRGDKELSRAVLEFPEPEPTEGPWAEASSPRA